MNKLKQLCSNLRSSFWFVPSLILLGSIALAIALINVDSASNDRWLAQWSHLFGAGAEGSRGMMSTIASSMMTVVGVTFSMILVVLALASSQYTSRILRNFIRSRVTQIVLGIFAGIFTYCLIVLRTIRSGDEGTFVPSLAVFFGLVMALGGVGTLMFFIHHIASSIQASNIIASVANETIRTIERLFPEHLELKPTNDKDNTTLDFLTEWNWNTVLAKKNGYIQSVDNQALLRIAKDKKSIVRMERCIGEFVVQDTPLVSLSLKDTLDQDTINDLLASFVISHYRTLEQDAAFGIKQIVDVALKALSPGIIDTTTAVMCVDYLTAILAQMANRKIPSSYRSEDGVLRVIAKTHCFDSMLSESFNQIRSIAKGDVIIITRMIDAFQILDGFTSNPQRRRSLLNQVQWTAEIAKSSVESFHEREKINARLRHMSKILAAELASCTEEEI